MQKQKKSYPSQSPLTNTQPTKTHKPNKHTTQQNQQAHNTTKPTSTPHKSNNSQQQKDWPLLTEHKHSGAWFRFGKTDVESVKILEIFHSPTFSVVKTLEVLGDRGEENLKRLRMGSGANIQLLRGLAEKNSWKAYLWKFQHRKIL